MAIPFNKPPLTGNEEGYVRDALAREKLSGDGFYATKCHHWFEEKFRSPKALLTPSCTHALEAAALTLDIKAGDEIIMPSFTFPSTANAFALRGATIVFVDIRPDTMNIDEKKIEAAISAKTRAIVVVHYAGIACEMESIMALAEAYKLPVIEDAAQAMLSSYQGKLLGSFGSFGTLSFHETKNYSSGGEGGLLLVNDAKHIPRAEIVREKGTNRSQFFRGEIDKYSWVSIGSSYLLGELGAAFLWGQLEKSEHILQDRRQSWHSYREGLAPLAEAGLLTLPTVPAECEHNGHMFYLKVADLATRTALMKSLQQQGILAIFHYVPLHTASAGKQYGRFHGEDEFTTRESDRLLRLPMYYGLSQDEIRTVCGAIKGFFDAGE